MNEKITKAMLLDLLKHVDDDAEIRLRLHDEEGRVSYPIARAVELKMPRTIEDTTYPGWVVLG
jgi:hypothetical protein